MPTIGGPLAQAAVGAVSVPENDWQGGFHTVDDIAARDALLTSGAVAVGMRVSVRTLPYVYEWDGAAWQIAERGNPAMAALVLPSTLVRRFLDTVSGDDEADGLTLGTSWASAQRCVDEFAGQAYNDGGNIQIQCVGACDAPLPSYGALVDGGQVVYFDFVGDTSIAALETFTMVAASAQPLNPGDPNGGALFGFKEHAVGAWATIVDEEVHWLEGTDATLGTDRVSGFNVLDESDEAAGDLRVSGHIDRSVGLISYAQLRLRARVTNFVRQGAVGVGIINNPHQRWSIRFIGCLLAQAKKIHAIGPFTGMACFFLEELKKSGNDSILPHDSVHLKTATFIHSLSHGEDNVGGGSYLAGIFKGAFDIYEGWWRMHGATIRSRLRVGAASRTSPYTGVHMNFVDFVGGTSFAMVITRGEVRIGDTSSGPVSCSQSHSGFVTMDRQSWLRVFGSRLFGASTSATLGCIRVTDGSRLIGVSGLTGQFTNEAAGGELQVGAVVATFADSADGLVDLDTLNAVAP